MNFKTLTGGLTAFVLIVAAPAAIAQTTSTDPHAVKHHPHATHTGHAAATPSVANTATSVDMAKVDCHIPNHPGCHTTNTPTPPTDPHTTPPATKPGTHIDCHIPNHPGCHTVPNQ